MPYAWKCETQDLTGVSAHFSNILRHIPNQSSVISFVTAYFSASLSSLKPIQFLEGRSDRKPNGIYWPYIRSHSKCA